MTRTRRAVFVAIASAGIAGCAFDTGGIGPGEDGGRGPIDAPRPDTPSSIDATPSAADAQRPDAQPPDAQPPDSGIVAGTALSFDGTDDFVAVAREVAGDFTIEAWIATTASRGGSQHYHGLGLVHADVAGNADDFGTAILDDHVAFGTGNPDTTVESTTEVTTGDWFHVAATRDQSTGIIRIYVNGAAEAMVDTANTDDLDEATTIAIGGNTIDDRFFEGSIDEVRIWDTVRTGPEIQSTMNTQLAGDEPGLLNYWRFDDGSGTTATDQAGTNDGLLGGAGSASAAPTWVPSDAPIF